MSWSMSRVRPGVRVRLDMAGEGGQQGACTMMSTAVTESVEGTLGTVPYLHVGTDAGKQKAKLNYNMKDVQQAMFVTFYKLRKKSLQH